ncbi:MAG: hypothetical protein WA580_03970 [Acidimicrobiales bacterium]
MKSSKRNSDTEKASNAADETSLMGRRKFLQMGSYAGLAVAAAPAL